MRGARLALGAGLALLAVALGVTLAGAPMTVAGGNRAPDREEETLASSRHGGSYCQAGETLPRGTSAIRLSLEASIGPRVGVRVFSAGRLLTHGEQESGWTGWDVTVPVAPLPHTVHGTTVCISFRVRNETVALLGRRSPPSVAARDGGHAIHGRMAIEYLRAGARSWGSLASRVITDMGFGRAWAGSAVVFVALALAAAVAALAAGLVFAGLR